MKNRIPFIIISIVIGLAGCFSPKKAVVKYYKYELYIDHQYVFFQGTSGANSYGFYVDSVNFGRYYGKIIVNDKDTLKLNGYEKGDLYPTWIHHPAISDRYMIFIDNNCRPYSIPDTIIIRGNRDKNEYFDNSIFLVRKSRK